MWTDYHEICCGCYAIIEYSKLTLFNFLQLTLPVWRMLEFVRWGKYDAVTYDLLGMRITGLTYSNLTQSCIFMLIFAFTQWMSRDWLDSFREIWYGTYNIRDYFELTFEAVLFRHVILSECSLIIILFTNKFFHLSYHLFLYIIDLLNCNKRFANWTNLFRNICCVKAAVNKYSHNLVSYIQQYQ